MIDTSLVYRKKALPFLILLGLVLMGVGIGIFTFIYQDITDFRAKWRGPGSGPPLFVPFIPLVMFGGIGLVMVVAGIASLMDREPKLTVEQAGLRDHRRSQFIPWDTIHSVDCQIKGTSGKLIVYNTSHGDVRPTEINIGDLEGGAQKIFTDIKAFRIQLDLRDGS